jgi:hypothetical protein
MERAGRSGSGWGTRFLIAILLVVVGAAAATWVLARWETAARVVGVVEAEPVRPLSNEAQAEPVEKRRTADQRTELNPAIAEQIGELQSRLQRVESETEEAHGSKVRADALLIAFSARRAIDRGVTLGYLEPLLIDRFGTTHPEAVATIVTTSRAPVRLTDLIARYQELEPQLVGPPPDEALMTSIKRGFSSLVSIRRSDRPSTKPNARYDRALSQLMAGEVDSALAETMRLPGAPRAQEWIRDARRYVAAHRAVDRIESAALVGAPQQPAIPR